MPGKLQAHVCCYHRELHTIGHSYIEEDELGQSDLVFAKMYPVSEGARKQHQLTDAEYILKMCGYE